MIDHLASAESLGERLVAHVRDHEPVEATRLGLDGRDEDLPDLDATAFAARTASLAALARAIDAALAAVPDEAEGDAREARGDLQLLRDDVEFRRFLIEVRPVHRTDPIAAVDTAATAVHLLLRPDRSDAVGERQRVTAAIARTRRIPSFLEAAGALLTDVPAPHLDVALVRLPGLVDLVRDGLPRRAEALGLDVDAARDAGEYAAEGIEAFGALLVEMADATTDAWRLGPDHHQVTLRAALGMTMDPHHIEGRARAAIDSLRDEMAEIAADGWARRFPGEAVEPDPTVRIRRSLAAIADGAVPAWRLLAEVDLAVEEARAFAEATGIVDVPPADLLTVEEAPGHLRGVAVAFLEPPAPLRPGVGSRFHISPVPDDADASWAASFLRECNPAQLRSLAIHEAYPGHFVQLEHAMRHPRLVRRLVTRPVFAEGWAVHVERVMGRLGFATEGTSAVHVDDHLLTHRKLELRVAANALLDVGLHSGGLTDEGAREMLTGLAFQEAAEVEGKVRRAKVTSGQLCSYFVGAEEFADLERAVAAREDPAHDVATFHRRLLSHGTPTVAIVAEALADHAPTLRPFAPSDVTP